MVPVQPKKRKRTHGELCPAAEANRSQATFQVEGNLSHISVLSYASASGDKAPGGILHTAAQYHPDLAIGWNEEAAGPIPVIAVSLSGGVRGNGMAKFVAITKGGFF